MIGYLLNGSLVNFRPSAFRGLNERTKRGISGGMKNVNGKPLFASVFKFNSKITAVHHNAFPVIVIPQFILVLILIHANFPRGRTPEQNHALDIFGINKPYFDEMIQESPLQYFSLARKGLRIRGANTHCTQLLTASESKNPSNQFVACVSTLGQQLQTRKMAHKGNQKGMRLGDIING